MNDRSSIRGVSFDAGGTLIEPWPSVGHVYANVAREHGVGHFAAEALTRRFLGVWQERGSFDYSPAGWRTMVNKTFAGFLSAPLPPPFFSALYERFAAPLAWRVYEDVVPALSVLKKRGFKLAVVSNWDERLVPLLGELELSGCFDALIVSHAVGRPKPSPEIFVAALDRLQLAAGEVLHVGDSREEDFEGASAVGLQSLLLRRGRGKMPAPPGQISSLIELLDLVGTI